MCPALAVAHQLQIPGAAHELTSSFSETWTLWVYRWCTFLKLCRFLHELGDTGRQGLDIKIRGIDFFVYLDHFDLFWHCSFHVCTLMHCLCRCRWRYQLQRCIILFILLFIDARRCVLVRQGAPRSCVAVTSMHFRQNCVLLSVVCRESMFRRSFDVVNNVWKRLLFSFRRIKLWSHM